MHHRHGKVRVSHEVQEVKDTLKVELPEQHRMRAALQIREPKDEVEGLRVIHGGRHVEAGAPL
jgi:hypothetical protein